ncbi:MAG: START domain-containing protein [Imperialibacter sp.]
MKVRMLLMSLLGFMSIASYAQQSWEIDRDKDGIIVYTKEEEGSAFKSFKAVMAVVASTDEIVEILKNADDYTKWYGYTKTSALLKQAGDAQYNYVETIFPWPYSNRDMVYRMSVNVSANGIVKILLKGIPDYVPEKQGIVRMKKAEGYILLQPIDGKTEVTYVFHSEPGDNIPPWLANNSIAELPFRTLSGLRKMLNE